jgi:hypothetical protein
VWKFDNDGGESFEVCDVHGENIEDLKVIWTGGFYGDSIGSLRWICGKVTGVRC